MRGPSPFFNSLKILPAIAGLVFLGACASIGSPQGGPRDEQPPVFVSANPAPGALNVSTAPHRLNVYFNENIELEDAFNKVVMSPPSKTAPTVRANGHRMTIDLRDSLLDSTTYTIDFGDAIKDLNEGNVLDGFALDFSTGTTIDSLRISGMVLDARSLEPQQGIIVGVHSVLDDSALTTLPLERVARTNQWGQFTVRGLAPGHYRVFAINDLNRDYRYDRSEDMAFYDAIVSPTVNAISVSDTLYSAAGEDSLVTRSGLEYLPADVLLMSFNEGYAVQHIKDSKRQERHLAELFMGTRADSLPHVTLVDGVAEESGLRGTSWERWALMAPNPSCDSLTFWLKDSTVIMADSLRLAVSYRRPDSTEQLAWHTDTLRFYYRAPRRSKKEIEADTLPPRMDVLSLRPVGGSSQELNRPFRFELNEPAASIDSAGLRLEMMQDTLWIPVAWGPQVHPDSVKSLLRSAMDIKWEPGTKYRLVADSAAIHSIYGHYNNAQTLEFTSKKPDDYSSLVMRIEGLDGRPAVVELLSSQDEPVYRSLIAPGSNEARLDYLAPGTYYLRLFIDTRTNGRWDSGDYARGIQPEETFYYPSKIELKKNWDIDQSWDLYALAADMQKPLAIKKNKPKLRRGQKGYGQDNGDGFDSNYEEDEEYNPFGGSNSGRRGSGNRTSTRRTGGLRQDNNQMLRNGR